MPTDDLKPRRPKPRNGSVEPKGGVVVKVSSRARQEAIGRAKNGAKAGEMVTVELGEKGTASPPTRYSLSLRRQAANRTRLGRGEPTLPPLKPGQCARCDGWGVVGSNRARCPTCGGSGR